MTLEVDLHYENIYLESLDNIIDNFLGNAWGSYDNPEPLRNVDISAIISRIANSPVLIKPEPQLLLDELCSV